MDEDELLKVLSIVSGVLAVMLSISEALAWSKCKWNSISEFLLRRDISCTRDPESQLPVTPIIRPPPLARVMRNRPPTPVPNNVWE